MSSSEYHPNGSFSHISEQEEDSLSSSEQENQEESDDAHKYYRQEIIVSSQSSNQGDPPHLYDLEEEKHHDKPETDSLLSENIGADQLNDEPSLAFIGQTKEIINPVKISPPPQ